MALIAFKSASIELTRALEWKEIFLLLCLQIYYQEKLNLIYCLAGFIFFLISLFTYEQGILLPIFLCLLLKGKSQENYFNKRLKYSLILLFAGF